MVTRLFRSGIILYGGRSVSFPGRTVVCREQFKENLLFVQPDATDEQLMDALHKAACDNLLGNSAHGIDTIIGESGMNLSGGEKQRISIAGAAASSTAADLPPGNIRSGFVNRGGYYQYDQGYFHEQGPDLPSDCSSVVYDHACGCDLCAGAGQNC